MSDTIEPILYREESEEIIGAAFEVLNELGEGLAEKPYENALVVEFERRKIPCEQQKRFEVFYKGILVGEYIPDLIVYEKILIDTKAIEEIGDREVGQMMNYLKIAGMRLGYLVNFSKPKLQWRRVVL